MNKLVITSSFVYVRAIKTSERGITALKRQISELLHWSVGITHEITNLTFERYHGHLKTRNRSIAIE